MYFLNSGVKGLISSEGLVAIPQEGYHLKTCCIHFYLQVRCGVLTTFSACVLLYITQRYVLDHHLIRAVTSPGDHDAIKITRHHSTGISGLSTPPGQTPPGSESVVIRLCTYNLWGHYFVGNFSDHEERYEAFADSMKPFDIVLVQEVFLLRTGPLVFSKYAEALIRKMAARGFRYRSDLQASLPMVFGQSSGVVIFSRVPVVSTKAEVFRSWGWKEGATNKGFAYVEVLLEGRRLFVFNLHLDAHSARTREQQIREVLNTIEVLPKPSFLVIGGDFNLDAPAASTSVLSKEYQTMRSVLARWKLRFAFPERPVTFPGEQSNTDQMVVSSNVKIMATDVPQLYTANGKMVSDHYGLSVTLGMSPLWAMPVRKRR